MFSKITKLNDYDKVTLIYEPTVQAKKQKSKVLTYLLLLVSVAIFLLGVNFAFHFLRFTQLIPPSPNKHPQPNRADDSIDNLLPKNNFNCPKANYDYLLLSIRWPPSFCNYGHCKKGARMYNWDIHGLWPDYKNGTYPSFCCRDYKFDVDQLKPIMTEMKLYWQDLLSNDGQDDLWTHEWEKHGTCTLANPILGSIINYFNSTLTLFKRYNVQQWLEEEHILPTSKKPYKLASILNTIESRMGDKRIKVECDTYTHKKEDCSNATYKNGKAENCKQIASKTYKLLDSIDLCFDKWLLEPIDCPHDKKEKYRKDMCDNDVYYFRTQEDLEELKF